MSDQEVRSKDLLLACVCGDWLIDPVPPICNCYEDCNAVGVTECLECGHEKECHEQH